jgi:hypothetical protein
MALPPVAARAGGGGSAAATALGAWATQQQQMQAILARLDARFRWVPVSAAERWRLVAGSRRAWGLS